MQKLKLGIAGCGFLANIVVDAWKQGLLNEYEIIGVLGRSGEKAEKIAEKAECCICGTVQQLIEQKPDYIVEAASVECVKNLAIPALRNKINLVILSIGAFADQSFYEEVQETARNYGARVHLASGAIGGFDVLRTITLMGMAGNYSVKAGIETRKGPMSLRNTPLFKENLMEAGDAMHVFEGNAKDAIAMLPTKVNVAVAASLASVGPSATKVDIYSVPGMIGDDHKITMEIEGVRTTVDTYSNTSAIAGWSVVSLLRNLVSPIVF